MSPSSASECVIYNIHLTWNLLNGTAMTARTKPNALC